MRWWGQICPPPSTIGLMSFTSTFAIITVLACAFLRSNCRLWSPALAPCAKPLDWAFVKNLAPSFSHFIFCPLFDILITVGSLQILLQFFGYFLSAFWPFKNQQYFAEIVGICALCYDIRLDNGHTTKVCGSSTFAHFQFFSSISWHTSNTPVCD